MAPQRARGEAQNDGWGLTRTSPNTPSERIRHCPFLGGDCRGGLGSGSARGKGHSGPPLGFQAAQIQLHVPGQECGLGSDKGRQSRARETGAVGGPCNPRT